jgi:hypothetical protein
VIDLDRLVDEIELHRKKEDQFINILSFYEVNIFLKNCATFLTRRYTF